MNQQTNKQNVDSAAAATLGRRRSAFRKLRSTQQTGFSMLSRGEPLVWLTGGLLVVCLVMIVALFGFIISSGLPTFWPRTVNLLVLNDGSLNIGQLQSTKISRFSDTSASSNKTAASQAKKSISWNFRTGNYDITNEHYRWFEADQLDSRGILTPSMAVIVERESWGRLYGLPTNVLQLQLLDPYISMWPSKPDLRPALEHGLSSETLSELSIAEQSLRELSNKVESNWLLSLINSVSSKALELRYQLNAELLSADATSAPAKTSQVSFQCSQEPEGDWQLVSSETSNIYALRKVWSNPVEVLDLLKQEITQAGRWRDEETNVKWQMSRLDASVAQLRLEVRQVELRSGLRLATPLEESHALLEELCLLENELAQLSRLKDSLNSLIGQDTIWKEASQQLTEYLANQQPEQHAAAQLALDEWLSAAALNNTALAAACRNYFSGYKRAWHAKIPLQSQLDQLERLMLRTEVRFAIPTDALQFSEANDLDISSLIAGQISPNLASQLKNSVGEAINLKTSTDVVSDTLKLVSIQTLQNEQRLLAVTSAGYTAEQSPSPQLRLFGEKSLTCREIIRLVDVNRLTWLDKADVYLARWHEFIFDKPRESNTEGGVFPAIWGMVVMTVIMTIAVVPFGIMSALYLREYAKSGPLVSLIRISINNLAGVPSIVYGVFGFSFFCYMIGAFVDGGAENADLSVFPKPIWFAVLAVAAVAGTSAFLIGLLSGVSNSAKSKDTSWIRRSTFVLWLLCLAAMVLLIFGNPFFHGFYQASLPNPTFGKGGLLWGSLTLALLTLPVVIVATEEALAAVPNSLREGSLACGASKWQTIRRIVLPYARPGILTGAILAMARGAGEVAPLMLVGALPSAPDLPADSEFPFVHPSRTFMHLGYQIFTLGFQSQNSEAAKPMVYTCTLLLLAIIATLNISAILLRNRLKRKFQSNQF